MFQITEKLTFGSLSLSHWKNTIEGYFLCVAAVLTLQENYQNAALSGA